MVDATENYDRAIEAAGAAAAGGDADSLELAENLYRKALTAGERAQGPFDLSLVPALTGLGAVLLQRGQTEEATPILGRAIAIGEQQLGAEHPDVAILLNDVTRLYLRYSAHAQAEPLLQRLLEIKRAKGDDHPEVATVLAHIASVRQTLGRHEEAEQLWRRVVDIRERTLAPNHIATASALEHLGLACAARGKFHDALELLQRALGMREITLGSEHPGLRSVRERIADLQLQASDDLLEAHEALPATTSRPRLSVAPHLASPLAVSTPASVAPRAAVRLLENDPLPAPAPASLAIAAANGTALALQESAKPPAAPGAVPYLNVLMDIKDEIEDAEPAPAAAPPTGWSASMAAIRVGFREHRMAAVAAVAGVLALPAIGFGVASAMRSNRSPEWAQSNSYAVVPQANDSLLASVAAPEALRALTSAGEVHRADSAAAHGNITSAAPKPRAVESRPATREVAAEEPEIPIIVQRPIVGRLDSVARSISVPSQSLGTSFEAQLESSLANARNAARAPMLTSSIAGVPMTPAGQRVKLIGELPVPRYPAQLVDSRVGGAVRVRFDVDTLGHPVMSTFEVVATPHPAFGESVKRVVPSMRFEPARSPAPVSQKVVESVEMTFTFVPSRK